MTIQEAIRQAAREKTQEMGVLERLSLLPIALSELRGKWSVFAQGTESSKR
ncbi:MAG TPA: hypothetical protein VFV38_25560 [Ktedonobacteraceae bacterium]|nr:hypothetical protein [Ktedonobacteraceae bacterium]